jgi:2-octaprenyl-6-methoxyphenol hydroxylase
MEQHDVIILGGGLVGLTLAIGLDAHGLRTALVDPMPPEAAMAPAFDGRASAIASATWRMYEALGVAPFMAEQACPIRRIEVRDGLQRDPLDFTVGDGAEPLGMMMENRVLREALAKRAESTQNMTRHIPAKAVTVERTAERVRVVLDNGAELTAPLLVAAEGRQSPTREAAGMRVARWDYDHTAIISAFDHSLDHNNVAHEIFYEDGPFAMLPLNPGTRSGLVWTIKRSDVPGILALSDRAFQEEVRKRAGSLLGEITITARRSTFPLTFHHATHMADLRLALVGDAGHGMHPIAGQGLNLGLRDVAALVEVLVEGARLGLDLGDAQLLKRYDRWRGPDALMVMAATDSLTKLFGLPGRPARAIRRFGLGAVQKISPLKSFFMTEARGTSGALPRLLQGAEV